MGGIAVHVTSIREKFPKPGLSSRPESVSATGKRRKQRISFLNFYALLRLWGRISFLQFDAPSICWQNERRKTDMYADNAEKND